MLTYSWNHTSIWSTTCRKHLKKTQPKLTAWNTRWMTFVTNQSLVRVALQRVQCSTLRWTSLSLTTQRRIRNKLHSASRKRTKPVESALTELELQCLHMLSLEVQLVNQELAVNVKPARSMPLACSLHSSLTRTTTRRKQPKSGKDQSSSETGKVSIKHLVMITIPNWMVHAKDWIITRN